MLWRRHIPMKGGDSTASCSYW